MTLRKLLILLVLLPLAAQAQKKTPAAATGQKLVTVEDVWKFFRFYAGGAGSFAWMADDNYYSDYDQDKNLVRISVQDESKKEVLIKAESLKVNEEKNVAGADYTFSTDEQKVLFKTDRNQIYRHSGTEACWVYDRKANKVEAVHEGQQLMYATFSPQADRIAYVKDNNLYVQQLGTAQRTQITTDGEKNKIINGASDWVYEEEFVLVQAFRWSPSGRYIGFHRFDESAVRQFSMDMFGKLYPEAYTFKYPKAGEDNAIVSLHIYDTQTGKTLNLDLPASKDTYYPRMWWTPGNQLVVARLNRHQNHLELLLINPETGASSLMLEEKSDTYINELNDQTVVFLKDGKRYLYQSEKDGYQHIYLRELGSSNETQITKGKWDVTTYYGVDEARGLLYYQSAEVSPLERHVYRIGLDGQGKQQLTTGSGTHSGEFSSAFTYYVHSYSSVDTPPVITLKTTDGKDIQVLQDNAGLRAVIKEYKTTKKEFFTFTNETGLTLHGWMMKPLGFSPKKKYPVLMYNYSGPGSQSVTNGYDGLNHWWYQHLCSQGYMVVCVDPRGTGARGRDFRACTYRQLGKYETEDLIAAAKYLKTLSYVDPAKVGVWGWSYGGYMSSLCITKGADHFRTAIAVAPVTNWRFYDTIYTERYMRTPQENASGYDSNSPLSHTDKLKGNYLLVHGMADDNVHLQNAAEMVDAMVRNNKDYEMLFYPNKNHGIYGGYTRLHLYRYMTDYLNRKLKN